MMTGYIFWHGIEGTVIAPVAEDGALEEFGIVQIHCVAKHEIVTPRIPRIDTAIHTHVTYCPACAEIEP